MSKFSLRKNVFKGSLREFSYNKKSDFMKKCTTCNKVVTDNKTEFKCPGCGKGIIIRCDSCKQTAKRYTCADCGFVGP